jgi:hypothetical protein
VGDVPGFHFFSLAPAMKQGIVTAVQKNVFNVAGKRFTG